MGANLIVSFLEIPKGKKPNWKKAFAHFEMLRNKRLFSALKEDQSNIADCLDTDEIEEKVRDALTTIRDVWEGEVPEGMAWIPGGEFAMGTNRLIVRLTGHFSEFILAGDSSSSWGDSVYEVDTIAWFDVSGCARAAGFLGAEFPSKKRKRSIKKRGRKK